LTDLLEDILWFLLITSVFSFIFYFVWLKFVDKTLKPLEDNLESMKNFVNDAGHELKTPISIIHWNLQIIKETKEFDSEAIKESIEEINRLDKLIESLVNLSTINSLKESVNIKPKEEIQYIIEKYDQIAKENDITINLKSKWDYKLNTNKEYFYIVFSNIISNAIKYNEKWWKIDIKIEKNKISIEDSWKWINDRDKPKIWDKFYRWWNLRNTTWFGIWLSLVKKICDLYAWEIKVESNEWKGTKFEVIFR
jgi:two-component system OmpR family sensor kinase